jgi:hemoglobin
MNTAAVRTLFDAHGGFAAISRLVLRFYDKVLQSDRLGPFFDHIDLARLVDHQTKFLTYLMGGPVDYAPARLRQAHAHLNVTHEDFDEIVRLLAEVLGEQGFSPRDRAQVLDLVERHRSLIVGEGGRL